MLQEGDQRCAQSHDLVRSNVHIFHFVLGQDREVACLARLDHVFHEVSFFINIHIRLGDLGRIFFLGAEVSDFLDIHLAIVNLAVRCFDKAHLIDLGVYA